MKSPVRVSRWRWLLLPAALLVINAMLLSAVALGIRLPGLGLVAAIADPSGFDYGHHNGSKFSPFSDAYLARVLGLANPGAAGASGRPGATATSAGRRSSSASAGRVVVHHALTNDDFANAYVVPSIPFTATTDTTAASRQTGDPGSCSPVGNTVWYRYTPNTDTQLFADTFGTSYTDTLAVFTGTDLDNLQPVGCDKNALGNAQVGFAAPSGTSYYFQITAPANGGHLVFDLTRLGRTNMMDLSDNGEPANDAARAVRPSISADNRYVAFVSPATNMAPHQSRGTDTGVQAASNCTVSDHCASIFVRDLATNTTELIVAGRPLNAVAPDRTVERDQYLVNRPSISGDGRYVTFSSNLSDLVAGDTNAAWDVFTYDRVTRHMERDSVSSSGEQANVDLVNNAQTRSYAGDRIGSQMGSATPDGRYVAFTSDASNLAPNSADGTFKTFVHDRVTGRTELVSRPPAGLTLSEAFASGISDDGRFVSFDGCVGTAAGGTETGIVEFQQELQCGAGVFLADRTAGTTSDISGPTVTASDSAVSADGSHVAYSSRKSSSAPVIYVTWDRQSGKRTTVSVSSSGSPPQTPNQPLPYLAPTGGRTVALSADGRFAVFDSFATGLVPNDTNAHTDVFVHDLVTGATARMSVSSNGEQGDNDSSIPTISADGSLIAFYSTSTNFAPNSDNGAGHVFIHENELAR